MQRRNFLGIAALLPGALLASHASQAALAGVSQDHAAALAAMQWLKLLDAGDYEGTWALAGAPFKNAVTAREWSGAAFGTRGQLGALKERKNKSVQLANSLPGAPDGEYAVVQFDSVFEKKEKGQESLTLLRETDGTWRVVGYFIR